VLSAQQTIDPVRIDQDKIEQLRELVPSDLQQTYEHNPAAVSRLLGSWEYVNQAAFDELPNSAQYLAGDLPNWALIGRCLPFKRDIEDSAYEQLLDFATDPNKSISVLTLLSPAGYGNSTLQMTLATRLVNERAGPVYFHKRGTPLIEGDILFTASLGDVKPFLFIDNASDYVGSLEAAIHLLRESRFGAIFVIGERINEWRQSRTSIRGSEFAIDKLSDGEIDRLLDYLNSNNALGHLSDLSADLRVSAIKKAHDKELLVAMKEATEGDSFDAIIEDEYQNIDGNLSKLLYAATCCTSLSRAHLRDIVAAQILNVDITELYEKVGSSLDGVVIWDCLDAYRGLYGARARHQVIARIVWNRCLSEDEKEKVLLGIMAAINLNFHADARAFEALVRSDENIDGIGSLEAKISFFETASKKDPDSPYVLQHFARMLLREDKLELALAQIKRAKELGQQVRIIHHTEGIIYTRLTYLASSMEVGRRYLVNAERAFQNAMDPGHKDAYPLQGLADLYFQWATKCEDENESTLYIRKAEEIIGKGIQTAHERDGLWIMSSKISAWLGDHPGALAALKKAVEDEPTSNVARYLLARAYRKNSDLEAAQKVLTPAIEQDPTDFRIGVAYAQVRYDLGMESQSYS